MKNKSPRVILSHAAVGYMPAMADATQPDGWDRRSVRDAQQTILAALRQVNAEQLQRRQHKAARDHVETCAECRNLRHGEHLKSALGHLIQWAIGNRGRKDGNPYGIPEIQTALKTLAASDGWSAERIKGQLLRRRRPLRDGARGH